jgi:hypothetical protein
VLRSATVIRRVPTTLAPALFLLGCALAGGTVKLVTIEGPVTEARGCFAFPYKGELIVDSTHGTALKEDEGRITPLMWPPGFTARWIGSEVEVLDPAQNVVATTGKRYYIMPLDEVHRRPEFVAGCVTPIPQ